MKHESVVLIVSLGILYALGGCQNRKAVQVVPELEPMSTDLIRDSSCTVPCWYGITPAVTTKEQVGLILNDLPFVSSFRTIDYPSGSRTEWNDSEDSLDGGIVVTQNGTVDYVKVRLPYAFELDDLVSILGDPQGTFVALPFTDSPVIGGGTAYNVQPIWPQQGVLAELYPIRPPSQHGQPLIEPDTLIFRVSYFQPVLDIEEYKNTQLFREVTNSDRFQPWNGYSSIVSP